MEAASRAVWKTKGKSGERLAVIPPYGYRKDPSYLLVVQLGLLNSIWALVLPTSVNVFNMLLLLSFFRNVPESIDDAARIDGAGQWRTLWQIYVPISLPVLAAVTLFTIVGSWNRWFDGMIYMKPDIVCPEQRSC
jgi:putative aldouronate transport system permease protein